MAGAKETLINYGAEVRRSEETKGRGLFATRHFKAGETIIEEQPLVSCQFSWNTAYGYAACDFCMRPLETAEENARRLSGKRDLVLPHPDADEVNKGCHTVCPLCAVSYCSEDCKDRAWNQYHETLCHRVLGSSPSHPLEQLNEAWKVMHYPPETASIMLLARILASFIQNVDREEFKRQLMMLCHRTVNEEDMIAHKLLGQEFVDQLERLRALTMAALGKPEISEFLSPEGFRSLFALIGRNGQGIGTSSFANWVRIAGDKYPDDAKTDRLVDAIYEDMEKESGDFLNNEGSALFFVQSACNHSCRPNSSATFPYSNHTLVLVATRDLQAGEEVFISYLDECVLERSRHSRRKILQDNYLFHCRCSKCEMQVGEPDVTSEEEDDSMEED